MTLTTEQIEQVIDDCRKGAAMRGLFNKWIVEEMASELLRCRDHLAELSAVANREAQPVNGELGKISVGRLPTMNQENYPGLGDWWVQLRIGVHNDEILARVYGATPEEATARAHALTAPPAPASEPIFFIEIEGDDWINAGRIPGSTFDFNNLPDGVNKLYAAPPAPAVPEEMTGGIAMSKYKVKKSNYVQWVKGWNACRAAMLDQPVSSGYKLPDNVREALTLALQAMEFMGDTLNNIDAVCTEDVEFVTPAFTAVRGLLAAAPGES